MVLDKVSTKALQKLTHWPLGDLDAILKLQFSILFYWLVSSHRLMIMPWDECQGTSPMISQQWFRQWLGAVRHQAIAWANVDIVPCRHMASPGHNELIESNWRLCIIIQTPFQALIERLVRSDLKQGLLWLKRPGHSDNAIPCSLDH